jgi:hypothetical protein
MCFWMTSIPEAITSTACRDISVSSFYSSFGYPDTRQSGGGPLAVSAMELST